MYWNDNLSDENRLIKFTLHKNTSILYFNADVTSE